MSEVSNLIPSRNNSEPEPPPWLEKLRKEVKGVRQEVQGLRQEVRSLRGEKDPARNITVDEAADLAGVSRRKLETLIHAGEVPSLKIGRRRLVPYRAFVAWLRSKAE